MFYFEYIQLPRDLKMISNSLPLLIYPFKYFVSTHSEIKVQVCTPKMSQYQHPLERNLAPQKQVCTHNGAISLSLHPHICAPLRVQTCTCNLCTPLIWGADLHLQGAEVLLWLQTWTFGVQLCTPIRKGTILLPKGAAIVTI